MAWHLSPSPKKLVPYLLTQETSASKAVVVCVVVRDVVCESVGVVVVVSLVVRVVVRLEVGVLVGEVVREEVGVDVRVVVGVVTSQPWNPPAANAAVIAFKVAAVAAQSLPSIRIVLKEHPMSSALPPAGPRNSVSAVFSAVAVAEHAEASVDRTRAPLQATVPVSVPCSALHAASTLFSTATLLVHWLPSAESTVSWFASVQPNSALNGDVVCVVVCVVVVAGAAAATREAATQTASQPAAAGRGLMMRRLLAFTQACMPWRGSRGPVRILGGGGGHGGWTGCAMLPAASGALLPRPKLLRTGAQRREGPYGNKFHVGAGVAGGEIAIVAAAL